MTYSRLKQEVELGQVYFIFPSPIFRKTKLIGPDLRAKSSRQAGFTFRTTEAAVLAMASAVKAPFLSEVTSTLTGSGRFKNRTSNSERIMFVCRTSIRGMTCKSRLERRYKRHIRVKVVITATL